MDSTTGSEPPKKAKPPKKYMASSDRKGCPHYFNFFDDLPGYLSIYKHKKRQEKRQAEQAAKEKEARDQEVKD